MPDLSTVVILLVFAGIAILIGVLTSRNRKAHEVSTQATKVSTQATQALIERMTREGTGITINYGYVPLVLAVSEKALCVLPQSALLEPSAVRVTHGVYGGPSIRIAKGLSFRFGRSQSTSESHDELREIDRGTLIVTTSRFAFIGQMRTIVVDLKKIVDVDAYNDGVGVHQSNKQKMEYFRFPSQAYLDFTVDNNKQSILLNGEIVKFIIDHAVKRYDQSQTVASERSSGAVSKETASSAAP